MATTPQFLGPDGVLRDDFYFTTTRPSRFLTGTISADTVDLQVSIRGGGFTSDPDYVIFEGTEFTIPNPASFPDGLDLVAGNNLIEVRAVDAGGNAGMVDENGVGSRIVSRVPGKSRGCVHSAA